MSAGVGSVARPVTADASRMARGWIVGGSVLVALALVLGGWVGFLASDDALYAGAAEGWLADPGYVPGNHWAVRHPVVLPVAASFAAFGRNEYALAMPTMLYWAGVVGLTAWQLVRRLPVGVVVGTMAVLVSAPLMVVWASIASADIAETFFVAASLWAFVARPRGEADGRGRMLLAGVLAGLAFLARDTAIALSLFYALCFVLGLFRPRRDTFVVGVGAAAVFLAETAWYWIAAGDPLHRLTISLNHDSTVDRSVDLAGNVLVGRFLDPLVMLLLNQEFALLFVAGLPAVAWTLWRAVRAGVLRRPDPGAVFAAYVVTWIALFYVAGNLLPLNPRYAMSIAYAVVIVLGFAASDLARAGAARLVALAAAAIVAANAVALLLENRSTTFGERTLAQVVLETGEPIRTDSLTLYRAQVRLEWLDAKARVTAAAPRPGDLYLLNPWRVPAAPGAPAGATAPAAWEVVSVHRPPPRLLEEGLRAAGIDRMLPAAVAQRVFRPNHPVTLYRVR